MSARRERSEPRSANETVILTADVLRAEVCALLDEPVDDHDNLLDAGLDSIRLMAVVERVRADGHDASFVDLAEEPTIAAWIALLERS